MKKMMKNETLHLEGKIINEVFMLVDSIAKLHNILTSTRGNYFHRTLLQALEEEKSASDIDALRSQAGLGESQRHIHKLLEFNLIQEIRGNQHLKKYKRTILGEQAINALRALEREIGNEEAEKITAASLGPNSMRLFLRVYGNKKEIDIEKREVRYTPAEIGKLSLFLPRTVEGIAAIDKLSDAELLVYKEEGHVVFNPKRARGFYKYMSSLYTVLKTYGPNQVLN